MAFCAEIDAVTTCDSQEEKKHTTTQGQIYLKEFKLNNFLVLMKLIENIKHF